MPAIHSGVKRVAPSTRASGPWGAPIEATLATLELIASEQPGLLEFQVHVLCSSTMSFAVQKIAAELGVSPEQLGKAIGRACMDLDRLEKQRGRWRDPAKIVGATNLAALRYVCRTRLNRASKVVRRRRLASIERRVEAALSVARTRAWVDDFIGPLPEKRKEAKGDVR